MTYLVLVVALALILVPAAEPRWLPCGGGCLMTAIGIGLLIWLAWFAAGEG